MSGLKVKLASLASNLAEENEGTEVPSVELPGVTFKVRSVNYGPWRSAQSAMLERHRISPPAPERADAEWGTQVANHLLLGWTGFDVEYSQETALAVLSDPSYRKVVMEVLRCAGRVGSMELEYVAEAGK